MNVRLTSTNLVLKLSVLIAACVVVLACVGWGLTPSFSKLQSSAVGSDRILESRDHQIAEILRTNFKRRRLGWLPLERYSVDLQRAVLEAEDRRFYSHWGVDPLALVRALRADLRRDRVQGASTISMQVSDLIQPDVLNGNQNIVKGSLLHKLAQIWRGFWIDRKWRKDEIFAAYLNLIHLRGEYQGVPALSFAYFKKDPLLLDQDESVAVATMISSPNQGIPALQKKSCALLKKLRSPPTSCTRSEEVVRSILSQPASMPELPNFAPQLRGSFSNKTRLHRSCTPRSI